MWYVIRTDKYREDDTRRLLLKQDGVKDVYLPLYRKTTQGDNGAKRNHFVPTISGTMLANFDEDKLGTLVNNWGYINYKLNVRNIETGELEQRQFVSRAHLLYSSNDAARVPRQEIIAKARVPERDVERLRMFNDRQVEGIEDLKILDVSYELLAQENDTVLITEGPYLGIEGVVKRVNERGEKDRRLHFSIGNFTVTVPRANKLQCIVIREARRGEKAREVNAWRHIDRLIGLIQARYPETNAASMLRDILRALNRDVRLDTYLALLDKEKSQAPADDKGGAWQKHDFLSTLDKSATGSLISLSRYFQTYDKSIDLGLGDLIPDAKLRPFLTPTPGADVPQDKGYTLTSHDGFRELILRTDLRACFGEGLSGMPTGILPTLSGIMDEDYTYYAHVALIPDGGSVTAVVSWGGFISQYLRRTSEERVSLLNDFDDKGYKHLLSLLSPSATAGTEVHLYNKGGITGFATELPSTHADDEAALVDAARKLIAACAPAAVEMWQSTKLLFWRKLAQRHVILHKVPLDDPI